MLIARVLLAAIAAALLFILNRYAPLQLGSVAAYSGFLVVCGGVLCLIRPIRTLGLKTRRSAALVVLAGIALAAVALSWPASTTSVARSEDLLDRYMPTYEFRERHEVRVHASPARVREAIQNVTFDELPAFGALVRIRAAAMGHRIRRPMRDPRPILGVMLNPHSTFMRLAETDGEILIGFAGRFWANQPARLRTQEDFLSFREPGHAKSAFNFRIEDLGGGWTRLSTETRIHAIDATARRALARYWRLIYPGIGIVRHVWLDAARERAERG